MRTLKLFAVLVLMTAFGTISFAQSDAKVKTGVFFFDSGKDMFYLEKDRNAAELDVIFKAIEENRDALKKGKCFITVKSYVSLTDPAARKLGSDRAKRVKSKLVMDAGANEDMFRTSILDGSKLGMNDVVVLNLPVYPDQKVEDIPVPVKPEPAETLVVVHQKPEGMSDEEIQKIKDDAAAQVAKANEDADKARKEAEKAKEEAAAQVAAAQKEAAQYKLKADNYDKVVAKQLKRSSCDYHFAFRANLLRWATLTPDLGIEWRISPSVGIAFNGTYTHWSWENWNKHWDVWEIRPEVKWYLGDLKNFYVGAMFHMGEYNYKISWNGYQGSVIGGGALIGYQLRLSDAFSMDFGLGLGATHTVYDQYWFNRPERKNVYTLRNETENVWGLTHLGVTLVWTVF